MKTSGMNLRCHCDHCQNNTCITHEHGLCWAQLSLDRNGEIEKKFNCFNQDSRLMQNLICDDSLTKQKAIVRCCSSGDYCNLKDDFLPPINEAKNMLLQVSSASLPVPSSTFSTGDDTLGSQLYMNAGRYSKTPSTSQSPSSSISSTAILGTISASTFDKYSNIPIEMKLVFIVIFGLMLVFALALFQNFFSRRKKVRTQVDHPEDHSENSSGLINSDAAVYDTNSMASREPLISNSNNINHNNQGTNPISLTFQQTPLAHPLPSKGPWMADETYNGKTQSTFQMSIGAGDPKKREASSGSGSGQPYLNQRSIAHDIELIEVVGRGYFGVVWRGEYKGEPVAVKIFSALAEPSWEREAEIYQTTLLRHKNILGFIATDKRDDVSMTGYWLVTDYYPMGSLYDFLKNNSLSMPDAVRMAFSIANGLAHLHIEIFGTQGKPAIAHRDLKSKNILVKNDGTCCIADLGMAVRYNSNSGVVDVPANTRVGTRRYLAPELLENKLNLMDFEAVKATDVYALGLVLWEVLRRTCYLHPMASPPQTYGQQVQSNPTTPQPNISPVLSSTNDQMTSQAQQESTATNNLTEQESVIRASTPVLVDPQVPNEAPTTYNKDSPQTSKPLQYPEVEIQQQTSQVEQQSQPLLGGDENFGDSDSRNYQYTQLQPQYEQYYQQQQQQQPPNKMNESVDTSIDDLNSELAIVCDPYQAPYQEHVSIDPTTDEMREIVCNQKVRPPTSLRWTKFAPMRDYTTLMRECWYEKPAARLSALRIRKTLGEIARHYFNLNMEYD